MKSVFPKSSAAVPRAKRQRAVSTTAGAIPMSDGPDRAEARGTAQPDQGDSNDIDQEMLARLRAAAAMPDDQINLTDPDAPLVTDWSGAVRGRFFRPVKRLKSFRIDADVLAWFEGQGKGYQATVNRVLREAMVRGMGTADAGKAVGKAADDKA